MDKHYQRIIDYIVSSGKRIRERAGDIADIGVTKEFLTEEDVAIERGLKEIISSIGSDHQLFAEEENDNFQNVDNLWAVDPISGTLGFIRGVPHYSVVVSHIHKDQTQFSAVYDPSVDELFTAYKGGGAFLNGKKIHVNKKNEEKPYVVFAYYPPLWYTDKRLENLWKELYHKTQLIKPMQSVGVSYCHVACGRYDGVITFEKDVFVEYAASLIIREAGGVFTTGAGKEDIHPDDRIFVGGNKDTYEKLFHLLEDFR